ncbi:g12175 [Coccomyxa viridis]|uniref:G12175 protein n=1 Tax=Coccomyxa viridis TaxID=1274662 RepID=A0ABP1G9P3_9CHLO
MADGATVAAAAIPIIALDTILQGRVVLGAANLYHFCGPANSDYFVALYPFGASSDADLYCSPYPGIFLDFGPPSPVESAWGSAAPVGADYVFMSQNDTAFEAAVNASGVAEFVCAVYGASLRGAQYSLTAKADIDHVNLAQPEQAALASIYQRCCTAAPGTCQYWDAVSSDTGTQVYTDFCNYGLSVCDDNGKLIKLDMTQMGLACEFPYAEVQAFQSLTSISFQGNDISGDVETIGASVKGLARQLTYLDLSFNSINGSFAGSSLEALFLNSNNLTSTIPKAISEASPLQALALGNNKLTGYIPSTLGAAAALTTLWLENNRLSGTIPADVASLPQLQSIRLYKNSLSGSMPEELAASTSLDEIDVGYNNLTAMPQLWISGDASQSPIAYIGMDNNDIAVGFLLHIADLPIGTPSGNLTFFPSLILLNASDNHFQGSLPSAFGQLAFFEQGDGTDATIVAKLNASEEGTFETLTHGYFSFAGNLLSGSLPAFLDSNQVPDVSMGLINLQDNQFSCPIPEGMQYLNVSCGATVLPPSGAAGAPAAVGGVTEDEQADAHNQSSWTSGGLSEGAKAGIAIAVIVVVIGGAALLCFCLPRYRRASRGWEKQALDQQFPLQSHGSALEMSSGRNGLRVRTGPSRVFGAAVVPPRPLASQRPAAQLQQSEQSVSSSVQEQIVRVAAWSTAAATMASAGSAQAASEVAQLAAGDNRVGIIATLALPALGWVAFNIGGPALNQLANMDKTNKMRPKLSLAAGLGLSAALLLASEKAEAAQEIVELAASDNRFTIILTLFLPVVGWVLFNIGGPALNQLANTAEKNKATKGASKALRKGTGTKRRAIAGAITGLSAASLLAAPQADAAQEVMQLAASDNRVGIIATLFLPVVGWVAFNIGGPALNQLANTGKNANRR